MPMLGIEVEEGEEIHKAVSVISEKLEVPDVLMNPFKGFIKYVPDSPPYVFIYTEIIWPNPVYIAFILTVVLWMASGFNISLWHIAVIPLWLGSLLFTRPFLKLAFKYDLRRNGYKGTMKFLSEKQVLMRASVWDNKTS